MLLLYIIIVSTISNIFCCYVIQLKNNDSSVELAVEILRRGGLISLPTDTVYGLAVDVMNSTAIDNIYNVKRRDLNKPLAICVNGVNDVSRWGDTDELPEDLLDQLLPGPVTLVLNRRETLNTDLNPGVRKIGIRVPGPNKSAFVRRVVATLGRPIALTSANPSHEPNCVTAQEFSELWPFLDVVFDGGLIGYGTRDGSTIVDLSAKGEYKIIRPGTGLETMRNLLSHFGLTES
uniref:Threonylcarbamoyl-AMP synthase n=1 Tax=Clastoptera arizonana TaxID=38151 RepID=A0A1B6DUS7_9HEMI